MERSPGKCIFTGPVYDRDALRAWNTRADLFLFPSTFDTNGLVVREAAACGLASVLIEGSCAAEGITDGRNGFIIEETPEALAALLQKMPATWTFCTRWGSTPWTRSISPGRTAWTRPTTATVILEKKAGAAAGKKLPADYLVALAARSMEEREKPPPDPAGALRRFPRDRRRHDGEHPGGGRMQRRAAAGHAPASEERTAGTAGGRARRRLPPGRLDRRRWKRSQGWRRTGRRVSL